jgi:glycosyltransferase involved in cell wall biosynthesis
MLDLTTFLALTRNRTAGIPIAFYFHENQLTYPRGPRQRAKKEPGFINYVSALAANRVFFNSLFHMEAFFAALPNLLKHYGDFNELDSIAVLRGKSSVLPLGVDLRRFDAFRTPVDDPPMIMWNHRWEPDKNPQAFFKALYRLHNDGFGFRVALLGENFRQQPTEFEAARERLGARIVHYGYAEDFPTYARLLWQARVVVSCAQHDFFGVSVAEGIYCGCFPLLVNRLNYPNLIPPDYHKITLFPHGGLYYALRDFLQKMPPTPPELAQHIAQFDWQTLAPQYDAIFAEMAA